MGKHLRIIVEVAQSIAILGLFTMLYSTRQELMERDAPLESLTAGAQPGSAPSQSLSAHPFTLPGVSVEVEPSTPAPKQHSPGQRALEDRDKARNDDREKDRSTEGCKSQPPGICDSSPLNLEQIETIKDNDAAVQQILAFYDSQRRFSPDDPMFRHLLSRGRDVLPILLDRAKDGRGSVSGFVSVVALQTMLGPQDEVLVRENLDEVPQLAMLAGKYNMTALERDIIHVLEDRLSKGTASGPSGICEELFISLQAMKSLWAMPILKRYVIDGPLFSRGWAVFAYADISIKDRLLAEFIEEQYGRIPSEERPRVGLGFVKAMIITGDKKGIDWTIAICEASPELRDWYLVQVAQFVEIPPSELDRMGKLEWLRSNREVLVWDANTSKFRRW